MGLCALCARRTAIVAAIAGAALIAIAGADVCASGLLSGYAACTRLTGAVTDYLFS